MRLRALALALLLVGSTSRGHATGLSSPPRAQQPRRVTIRALHLEGYLPRLTPEELLAVGLAPGRVFHRSRLSELRSAVGALVRARGYGDALVRLEARPVEGGRRVDLVLRGEQGPL